MNQNGKISFIVFLSAMILIFTAIALCAFEKVNLSSTIAMVACGVCIPGFYYAFESWKEEDEPEETAPAMLPAEEMQQNTICRKDNK